MKKAKVSKYGQWKYPGEDTIIPNANGSITMQGVPYPVLGIDDQGNRKMMMPGGEYQFPGNSVYEIPMAKRGLPKAQTNNGVPTFGGSKPQFLQQPGPTKENLNNQTAKENIPAGYTVYHKKQKQDPKLFSNPNTVLDHVIEFVDPTGIMSYDDAGKAYSDWKASGNTVPTLDQGLSMFSAIPVLGKFGKFKYADPLIDAMKPVIKTFPWQQALNLWEMQSESQEDYKKYGGNMSIPNLKQVKIKSLPKAQMGMGMAPPPPPRPALMKYLNMKEPDLLQMPGIDIKLQLQNIPSIELPQTTKQRVVVNTAQGDKIRVQDPKTKKFMWWEDEKGLPTDIENPTGVPYYDFRYKDGGALPMAQRGPGTGPGTGSGFLNGHPSTSNATYQDSLDVANQGQAVMDWYNSQGYYGGPDLARNYQNGLNQFIDVRARGERRTDYSGGRGSELSFGRDDVNRGYSIEVPGGVGDALLNLNNSMHNLVDRDNIAEWINPNQFRQYADNNLVILNDDAPKALYDTRIKPRTILQLKGMAPGYFSGNSDLVDAPVYEKWYSAPWSILSEEDKRKRIQFGILDGTPYDGWDDPDLANRFPDLIGGGGSSNTQTYDAETVKNAGLSGYEATQEGAAEYERNKWARNPNEKKKDPNPDTDVAYYMREVEGRSRSETTYENRKKIAEELGIDNYSGTAQQNIELIKRLKEQKSAKENVAETVVIPEREMRPQIIPNTPAKEIDSERRAYPIKFTGDGATDKMIMQLYGPQGEFTDNGYIPLDDPKYNPYKTLMPKAIRDQQKIKKLGGFISKAQMGLRKAQDGLPTDYESFLKYSETAPENRRPDSEWQYGNPRQYDHYGMWDALGKPENFDQALQKNPHWQPDPYDETYHGFSTNPNTGVWLKSHIPGESHPGDTGWMEYKDFMLSNDRNWGGKNQNLVYDPDLQRMRYIDRKKIGGVTKQVKIKSLPKAQSLGGLSNMMQQVGYKPTAVPPLAYQMESVGYKNPSLTPSVPLQMQSVGYKSVPEFDTFQELEKLGFKKPVSVYDEMGQFPEKLSEAFAPIDYGPFSIPEDYYTRLMHEENGINTGLRDGRFYQYPSHEKGTDTIGYGHKLTEEESKAGSFNKGLTKDEAIGLMRHDVDEHLTRAKEQFNEEHGSGSFDKLHPDLKVLALDFVYNGIDIKEFPNFFGAAKKYSTTKDTTAKKAAYDKMMQQYVRHDDKGVPLGSRNEYTKYVLENMKQSGGEKKQPGFQVLTDANGKYVFVKT